MLSLKNLYKSILQAEDKEKALNYLHHSAPIAEALSDSRLSSAAKVVENFVNPKISAGNVEKMQKNYTGAVMARLVRWQETPVSVL